MPPDKICKTVHQYNKEPVSEADMQKLLDIAEDYRKVKNYVYVRYGGIGGLSKIYPGYTVQNEMTASGYSGRLYLMLPGLTFCTDMAGFTWIRMWNWSEELMNYSVSQASVVWRNGGL